MSMNPIEILTPKALATRLGVTYGYVRMALVQFQQGKITSWKGYTFFGKHNKAWYAYKADLPITIIDEDDA